MTIRHMNILLVEDQPEACALLQDIAQTSNAIGALLGKVDPLVALNQKKRAAEMLAALIERRDSLQRQIAETQHGLSRGSN